MKNLCLSIEEKYPSRKELASFINRNYENKYFKRLLFLIISKKDPIIEFTNILKVIVNNNLKEAREFLKGPNESNVEIKFTPKNDFF